MGSTSEGIVTRYAVCVSDRRFSPSTAHVLTAEIIRSSDLGNKTLPF